MTSVPCISVLSEFKSRLQRMIVHLHRHIQLIIISVALEIYSTTVFTSENTDVVLFYETAVITRHSKVTFQSVQKYSDLNATLRPSNRSTDIESESIASRGSSTTLVSAVSVE